MSKREINLSVDAEGIVTRDEDKKHVATIDLKTGEPKFANAAYAKGDYRASIEAVANKFFEKQTEETKTEEQPENTPPSNEASQPQPEENTPPVENNPTPPEVATQEVVVKDARIPSVRPEKDPNLGYFSAAHINYDHANMSDDEFAKKYKKTAEVHLDFIAARSPLFADLEALEERLASLIG